MRFLRTLLMAFCALVLVLLVAVPFTQVLMRDIVGAAIIGAEEFTRFLLIILVFAAYPLVVMDHENIVMAEFREALPKGLQKGLVLVVMLCAVAAAAFMAWVTWQTIFRNLNNATPTLKIPFWLFLGATFLGFALAALMHLRDARNPPREQTRVQ